MDSASDANSGRDPLWQLAVIGIVFLLPLVFDEGVYPVFWVPKSALLLLLLGPGLILTLRLAAAGNFAARVGLLVVASATLSTVMSDQPLLATVGLYNWGTGLLFLISLVGCWAFGTSFTATRRQQLVWALIAAATINAVFAWIRLAGPPGPLFDYAGGSVGLMGNASYLAALLSGALWLVSDALAKRSSAALLVPLFLIAGAEQLTQERLAIALGLLALLVPLRRAGWRRATLLVGVAVLGFTVATAVSPTLTAAGRIAPNTGEARDARPAEWRVALAVSVHSPIVGSGPDRFAAVVEPHATFSMAGPSDQYFTDAHNFLVNTAVTLGYVGLVVVVGWLFLIARRAWGPLAGFALILGLSALFQPETTAVTPLLLLALGSAGEFASPLGPRSWPLRASVITTTCVGAVAAALLFEGNAALLAGLNHSSLSDARRASRLLAPWAEPVSIQAQVENDLAIHGSAIVTHADAVKTAQAATRRDPANPGAWIILAGLQDQQGDERGALGSFQRASHFDPWLSGPLARIAELGTQLAETEAVQLACRRLAVLRSPLRECASPRT